MRICYVAPVSIHTKRWMKYFADAGHEVHLITSDRVRSNDIENVKLHLLKRFGPKIRSINYFINTLPLMLQFKKLIKHVDPDIIHAHYIMETTLLGAASGFHPFVVTAWGSDVLIAPQKSKLSMWMAKYMLKRADLITTDGEHLKKPLMRLGGDPQKIKIIYFGVDTQQFAPSQKGKRLSKELGVHNSPTIISLRRLEPIYNVESLIQAVPLVLKEVPEAKFLVIDKGSEEVKLKQLAESLDVSESVRFLGWIPVDKLPQYIALSDICVSTSLSDAGLASSTAEAMACGLPVIITDFGSNRIWVEDGVNGFLVPLKDPKALALKIIYLLQNKGIRKKFGQFNRQIIEEKNNWEKEMHKMSNLYEKLIEKCKS